MQFDPNDPYPALKSKPAWERSFPILFDACQFAAAYFVKHPNVTFHIALGRGNRTWYIYLPASLATFSPSDPRHNSHILFSGKYTQYALLARSFPPELFQNVPTVTVIDP